MAKEKHPVILSYKASELIGGQIYKSVVQFGYPKRVLMSVTNVL